MNQRIFFFAAFASLILVTSTFGVYVATWSPQALVVTDGSITGMVTGDFPNITSTTSALIQYFNATTYVNRSGRASSTITIEVYTFTYCVVCGPGSPDGGYLLIDTTVTAVGHLASDLHPASVSLAENQTAATASGGDIRVDAWSSSQNGTNVSYRPEQVFGFVGSGSGTVTATPVNQTGKGPSYVFEYQDEFAVKESYWYSHFVGFKVSVEGLGTTVGVGVLLQIVDSP